MRAQMPQGAELILASRMRGLKPADMVIVSMVGPAIVENPVVRVKPDVAYDWRWVRGLDVCLYIADESEWHIVLKEIALQRPEHLSLWSPAGKWGAAVYLVPTDADINRPVRQWKYELDFTPWMDFQNQDFVAARTYARDHRGVPYAAH